jgi:hypothetical protein
MLGLDLVAILSAVGVAFTYAGTANELVGLSGAARSLMQWARHWESAPPSPQENELHRIAPITSLVQKKIFGRLVILGGLAIAGTIGGVKMTDEVVTSSDLQEAAAGLAVGGIASTPALTIRQRFNLLATSEERAILKAYEQRYERFVASEADRLRPLSHAERLVLQELTRGEASLDSMWKAIGRRAGKGDSSIPTQAEFGDAGKQLFRVGDIEMIKGPLKKMPGNLLLKEDCRMTPKGLGRLADTIHSANGEQ